MNKVYLVGAGPFDKELITVKGQRLIQEADVIVYDYLANAALLGDKKESCETIYVGKSVGNHTMSQDEINRLLVELGKTDQIVVRLKGGDPYVFGRGGEEGKALYDAGIPFEVVPGITSTIGGLTYAGIPITSRGVATSFHVLTGHFKDNERQQDFESLAKLNGTIVFVMGVRNLALIVNGLMEAGKAKATPIAIIYKASSPEQYVTEGTLETIVDLADRAGVQPPSLVVIGDVVKERSYLDFFKHSALLGAKIVVTRSRDNHSKLTEALTKEGAQVIQLPTIKTVSMNQSELERHIKEINQYDLIVFTSGVAAERFFDSLAQLGFDNRHLGPCKVVSVGTETAKKIKSYGINTDYIPEVFSNEGVLRLLERVAQKGQRLLVPRSKKGDTRFITELEGRYNVDEISCYDTRYIEEHSSNAMNDSDYITFTSASTVHGFVHCFGEKTLRDYKGKIVAIGPKTKEVIIGYGAKEDLMPKTYTIKDMVQCIKEDRGV